MKILAIDPGMSGAVVLVGPGLVQVRTDFKHPEDLPRAIDELASEATVAVIELVASRPGQGVSSMFNFGMATGVALGSLYSNGFSAFDKRRKKLIEVTPWKWQRYFRSAVMSQTGPVWGPFDSKKIALEAMAGVDEFLTRGKDHNTADAILMAIWYICTVPEDGSFRARDAMRLPWLQKRFNL